MERTKLVHCPDCQCELAVEARFCHRCGSPLPAACDACGAPLVLNSRFCAQCGRPLEASAAGPSASPAPAAPAPTPVEGERRHLTVMFCDLVDSTVLAERLDPEDLRGVMRRYQAACAERIAREQGHVAQYLGDGLLVFFGYPQAGEDDSERAVRAALGIVEEIQRVSAELQRGQGVELAVRIGINSGPVVIGEVGDARHRETQALGHTMNLAARLEALAPRNGVVISQATLRLVRGLFVTRDLGSHDLKGIRAPVLAYEVLRATGARDRLELIESSGLTPLVGRRGEVALLSDRWQRARAGRGQTLLIDGEAGMGKTRLVRVLHEEILADQPHTWLTCRGSPQHVDSALHPLIDLLRRGLSLHAEAAAEANVARIEDALASAGLDVRATLPLIASLLELPLPAGTPPPAESPALQRRRTLETLVRWLFALSEQRPMVMVVEDLHWIDPSTIELLDAVVDGAPDASILLVATYRPSFDAPWKGRPAVSHVVLQPLALDDVRAMIASLGRGKAVPDEVCSELVAKTDGTPIFVEELTKMVLESGLLDEREDRYELSEPLPKLAIPATLQDSLMARLDRLSPVKGVAQLAATVGREFSYPLLAAVASTSDEELQGALQTLVDAEILLQRGAPPRATFSFRHALIQDAAYGSLLRTRRQESHRRIALVLQESFPELTDAQPEVLARHLQEAGLAAEAIACWRRAGQRAMGRSAMVEAVRHLQRAIELLADQPASPERDQQELALQAAISLPIIATRGYGSRDAEQAITRAKELCGGRAAAPEHFPVLRGVWTYHEIRADYVAAREVADRLVALADAAADPVLQVGALHSLGITELFSGEFAAARRHLVRANALYDPERQRSLVSLTPMDPGVSVRGFGALALWFEGRPDAAMELSETVLPLARELAQPFNVTWALLLNGWMRILHGDWVGAREHGAAAAALSAEQAFQNSAAFGAMIEGCARSHLGEVEPAIEQLDEGLRGWRETGTEMARSHFLSWYAEACLAAERCDEGLRAIREGFAHAEHEPFVLAELHRLEGELLLAGSGEPDDAEARFTRALEVAREQRSRSLELRAAHSAARLLQHQGRKQEARTLLDPIYGAFDEGFRSRDLREAAALLDVL